MPLTEREIKAAKPQAKQYKLSDSGNLFLLVTPAGGKLWRWAYRFHSKPLLMALGKYPEVSLADARQRHQEARLLLSKGTDPMAQRKREKQESRTAHENSFTAVAERWLLHWREGKSARHADTTERRLRQNILPCLGNRPINEIEAPDVVAMVLAIQERGARDIAKRALETTGQVFRFAIARGYARRNPAAEIKPRDILPSSTRQNFARVDAKELPALLLKIELYQGTHVTRLAMKLLALTFVRTGELIGAPWSEIDFQAKRWEIPAERMKMRTPHIVPLSEQAVEVLQSLHVLTGAGKWIFPGDRDSGVTMSNNTILRALDRMGFKGRMTGHGFRGLASTILHEQGYPHEHIELQLAHAPRNEVSAAYNHALYLKPRAAMMQAWANHLCERTSAARQKVAVANPNSSL